MADAARGDAEECERDQDERGDAALGDPGDPVAARPGVRRHAGIAVAERWVVPRGELRVVDRPVAGADAEKRVVQGHAQRLFVLHEPSAPAAAFVIGHVLDRLQVRVPASPAKRVRQEQRGGDAGGDEDDRREESPPGSAIAAQRRRGDHGNEEDHDDRGEGEPGRARARQHE